MGVRTFGQTPGSNGRVPAGRLGGCQHARADRLCCGPIADFRVFSSPASIDNARAAPLWCDCILWFAERIQNGRSRSSGPDSRPDLLSVSAVAGVHVHDGRSIPRLGVDRVFLLRQRPASEQRRHSVRCWVVCCAGCRNTAVRGGAPGRARVCMAHDPSITSAQQLCRACWWSGSDGSVHLAGMGSPRAPELHATGTTNRADHVPPPITRSARCRRSLAMLCAGRIRRPARRGAASRVTPARVSRAALIR